MKKKLLILCTLPFCTHVHAQTTILDQINAVDAVQQKARQQENTRREQIEEDIKKQQRERLALERKRQISIENSQKREQSFEDQVRNLKIQEAKIKLQAEQARANRENDYIDSDIKRQNAQTDLIQSQADSNRNISSGAKNLMNKEGEANINLSNGAKTFMEKEGEADLKKNSSFFSR